MNRFFTNDIKGDVAYIHGDDVHHICRVLRLSKGEAVAICDANATDYRGIIESIGEDLVTCRLFDALPSPTEPDHHVTLFQGLPKTGKMETIIQKCVELGIFAIIPTMMHRCVCIPKKDMEKKRVRWQRVAQEAAKQSRRGIIPAVLSVVPLQKLDAAAFDTILVAYEDEHATTLKSTLQRGNIGKRIAIVIGPEGGFEPTEIELLSSLGAIPVSLGSRILRTETAGMAMLATLLYEVEG